eukprot:12169135-Alexandrium_andersonii.AAC.1
MRSAMASWTSTKARATRRLARATRRLRKSLTDGADWPTSQSSRKGFGNGVPRKTLSGGSS